MALLDIVNFNSDASCMSSKKWLKSLEGGNKSIFCKFLSSYINHQRKVNIGFTGVTIKDLAFYNPEALEMINEYPDLFEILPRCFSHDLSPLCNTKGFRLNLETGLKTVKEYFNNYNNAFLQNEVMILNHQIEIICEYGIEAIFIRPERFNESVQAIIPPHSYYCRGTGRSKILNIPMYPKLDLHYLSVLHGETPPSHWIELNNNSDLKVLWRDGESAFLFPAGIEIEERVLKEENKHNIKRYLLSEKLKSFHQNAQTTNMEYHLKHFPHHPLDHWLKDFKMLWVLERLNDIEKNIDKESSIIQKMWLLAINSDIMASSEKPAPTIKVHPEVFNVPRDHISWDGVIGDEKASTLSLLRSERYFEGEEYIELLEKLLSNRMSEKQLIEFVKDSDEPHFRKVYSRVL